MSGILLVFTKHVNIKKNTTNNEEKSKSTGNDPYMTQKIDSVDKDTERF